MSLKNIETCTPNSNHTESETRELKRSVGREIVRSKSPKVFWDDCIELVASQR